MNAFNECINGVSLSLEHENKEKFLSQLTGLKSELQQFAIRMTQKEKKFTFILSSFGVYVLLNGIYLLLG